MRYDAIVDEKIPGVWRAEAISQPAGEHYAVLFSGPDAEARAREFADWANRQSQRAAKYADSPVPK